MINTENRFSGIPTVIQEMEDAGLQPPVFESRRGNFKVILYNHRETTVTQTEQMTSFDKSNEDSIQEKIRTFCVNPRSREEIAEHLNIASSYYLVTKYLKPMMEIGVIAMTIPEKPKSKFQKYYTVK